MKKNNSFPFQLELKNASIHTPLIQPRRKRANEKTLEEATANNNFNYKLSNEDIINLAYIKFNNFQSNNEISLSDFSIIENVEQLVTQIYSFQLKTLIKPRVFHTLLVNLSVKQWVSIVFSYQDELTKLYYIDPSGNLLTEDYLDFKNKQKELHRHNNIFLRKKILLTAFATMPDPPLEGKIIGLSGFNDTHPDTQNNTPYFQCDNAIGVARNQENSNGIYVIALGEGNDKAWAPLEKSIIFYVYNGTKMFIGGDQDNLFIIADVGVSGCLIGGKKDNLLKLVDLLTTPVLGSLIDNRGMLCFQPIPLLAKQCQTGLKLNKIHKIFGRHNQSDTFYSNENITFIDGLGGKNSFERDHIYITQHTFNNLQIILRPNTVISYFESILLPTTIFYNLTIDQEGESWLHLNFQEHLRHQFDLNFPLDSFQKMTKEFLCINFKFSYQQKNFNLTFSFPILSNSNQIELNFFKNTVFVFNKNVLVRFFKKNYLYIKENNNFTINPLLSIYAPLAKRNTHSREWKSRNFVQ